MSAILMSLANGYILASVFGVYRAARRSEVIACRATSAVEAILSVL